MSCGQHQYTALSKHQHYFQAIKTVFQWRPTTSDPRSMAIWSIHLTIVYYSLYRTIFLHGYQPHYPIYDQNSSMLVGIIDDIAPSCSGDFTDQHLTRSTPTWKTRIILSYYSLYSAIFRDYSPPSPSQNSLRQLPIHVKNSPPPIHAHRQGNRTNPAMPPF